MSIDLLNLHWHPPTPSRHPRPVYIHNELRQISTKFSTTGQCGHFPAPLIGYPWECVVYDSEGLAHRDPKRKLAKRDCKASGRDYDQQGRWDSSCNFKETLEEDIRCSPRALHLLYNGLDHYEAVLTDSQKSFAEQTVCSAARQPGVLAKEVGAIAWSE